MQIEKKEKVMEVFTVEGKEFLSEKAANDYLVNVVGRLKNMKYFTVSYNPDLTEGRGCYGKILVAVEMSWSHKLMVELLCEQCIGSRVAWVQGCSPTSNWNIYESKKEDFEDWKKQSISVGDYSYKAKRVFLSHKEDRIDGYPKTLKMPSRDNQKFSNLEEYLKDNEKL